MFLHKSYFATGSQNQVLTLSQEKQHETIKICLLGGPSRHVCLLHKQFCLQSDYNPSRQFLEKRKKKIKIK